MQNTEFLRYKGHTPSPGSAAPPPLHIFPSGPIPAEVESRSRSWRRTPGLTAYLADGGVVGFLGDGGEGGRDRSRGVDLYTLFSCGGGGSVSK